MHYSVQPRDWIFVKVYGFLSFAKNIKKLSKNVSDKYRYVSYVSETSWSS